MKSKFSRTFVRCIIVMIAMLLPSNLLAQEEQYTPLNGAFNFLAVKDLSLKTDRVYKYGEIEEWNGEGFHAGIQLLHFTLFNCKDIPKDIEVPKKVILTCVVKDQNGNEVARAEGDMTKDFNKLKFLKKLTTYANVFTGVIRGGKYTFTAEISDGLFSYQTDLELPDEPSIQIFGKTTTIDDPLCPEIIITSGYPYSPSDYSGEKQLHWQMASVNSPEEVIAQNDETFELLSETPTLAAVDTLYLEVKDIEPGEYQYTLTSDYAPANYSFMAKVCDVLKPVISFNKTSYVVGQSEEAEIKVEMSYRYPYVGKPASSSGKPTVEVIATLMDQATSVSYSDETWANSDMHCDAELKVPLGNVTEEIVKANEGKVPLQILIKFNGNSEFDETVYIPFDYVSSGITNINTDNSGQYAIKYFNIFGVEVNDDYHGIVITSDGRKIIR